MTSDWRVLDQPLRRRACTRCGLVSAAGAGPDAALFAEGYSLYARPPGDPHEAARQAHYAAWIARATETPPSRVLDVGCGNGSLLCAMAAHWPDAKMFGCDLSRDSVAHGRRAGLMLWAAAPDELPDDVDADLVVTVNVLEHVLDPESFLTSLGRRLAPGGRLVIVCPDGTTPGIELLIADHRFSFERAHLEILAVRSGLAPVAWSQAPPVLGAFQMLVVEPGWAPEPSLPVASEAALRAKAMWLARWTQLDDRLLERIGGRQAVCFGAGETAGLLRAYAPRAWERVEACTADRIASGAWFGSVPIIPLDQVDRCTALVVGVRPQDQPGVAERLKRRFDHVVTWYDLLDTDPP